MKEKKVLAILSALAQESRLSIFRLLMEKGGEGLSAGAIAEALQIPPTTLSFHLAHLHSAGIIESRKEGRSVIYSTNRKKVKKMTSYLLSVTPPVPPPPEEFLN